LESKVELSDNFVFKYNTSQYSSGLEWVTELLSINHQRELRVYSWHVKKKCKYLLIPKIYEMSNTHLKLEKLTETNKPIPTVFNLIPNIIEFSLLGYGKKRKISDFISSPSQSVVRGILKNFKFLGFKIIQSTFLNLFKLYKFKPTYNKCYLIHKDLKINQNMINTSKGVYFIDFGSSIITKNYFLADIVELATDHYNFKVNFELIKEYIIKINAKDLSIDYLRSQLYLLLLRRYLHFSKVGWADTNNMIKVKKFLSNLDDLVLNLKFNK
jgi:hypothetical protein